MGEGGGSAVRFPGGRTKALSMSYDDGSEHDRRLVALFDHYGLRGSFHLTSSTLGLDYRIGRNEVRHLYARHEVACHGATHADLTGLPDEAVRRELRDDKTTLEAIAGRPVRGLAYPFGSHDARTEGMAAEAGFAYARGITDTGDFDLPASPLRLTTTCHHNDALDLGRRFLDADDREPRWMRVRGHSFELDGFMTADSTKDWAYMESFCRLMAEGGGIWFAPLIEVLDHLEAAGMLRR